MRVLIALLYLHSRHAYKGCSSYLFELVEALHATPPNNHPFLFIFSFGTIAQRQNVSNVIALNDV